MGNRRNDAMTDPPRGWRGNEEGEGNNIGHGVVPARQSHQEKNNGYHRNAEAYLRSHLPGPRK